SAVLLISQARDGPFYVHKSVNRDVHGLDGKRTGGSLEDATVENGVGIVRVVDERNANDGGRDLLQYLKRLAEDRQLQHRKAGDVAARPRQACRPANA